MKKKIFNSFLVVLFLGGCLGIFIYAENEHKKDVKEYQQILVSTAVLESNIKNAKDFSAIDLEQFKWDQELPECRNQYEEHLKLMRQLPADDDRRLDPFLCLQKYKSETKKFDQKSK